MQKKKINIKSLISTILCLFILIGALAFGLINYNKIDYTVDTTVYLEGPINYEIVVNPSTRVLKITANDTASKEMIKDISFEGASLNHALNVLVNKMIEESLLKKDVNLLMAFEYSIDSNNPQNYHTQFVDAVENLIKINDIECNLWSVAKTANDELYELARQNNISVGRALFVKEIEIRNRAYVNKQGINNIAVLPLDELCKLY